MDGMLQKLGLEEGEAIIHPWINKALEKAQKKVEERNFEIRKNLLKFDDVMNDQRKVIYEQRKELMAAESVQETVDDMRLEVIDELVAKHIPAKTYAEQWDGTGLHTETLRVFGLDLPVQDWLKEEGIAEQEIRERITDRVNRHMAEKTANYGPEVMRMAEKSLLLQLLDQSWKDHLLSLDHLRQGIHLRGYAQRDPLNEYKSEAFNLFEEMISKLRETVTGVLAHLEIRMEGEEIPELMPERQAGEMQEGRDDPALALAATGTDGVGGWADEGPGPVTGPEAAPMRPVRNARAAAVIDPDDPSTWGKVQRNAPCPCGSGKKYKHCHGKVS